MVVAWPAGDPNEVRAGARAGASAALSLEEFDLGFDDLEAAVLDVICSRRARPQRLQPATGEFLKGGALPWIVGDHLRLSFRDGQLRVIRANGGIELVAQQSHMFHLSATNVVASLEQEQRPFQLFLFRQRKHAIIVALVLFRLLLLCGRCRDRIPYLGDGTLELFSLLAQRCPLSLGIAAFAEESILFHSHGVCGPGGHDDFARVSG